MNYYQTIIITQNEIKDIDNLIGKLENNGILWIISEDLYNSDEAFPETFKTIEELSQKGLKLKNIIVWINKFENIDSVVINIYKNILFFVKSESYYFNKDPIREKHIWKNVDWGKRPENYNPKGKDPSNVWIQTEDDDKGKITKFIPLTLDEVIRRCILCSTKEGDSVLLKVKTSHRLTQLNRGVKYE